MLYRVLFGFHDGSIWVLTRVLEKGCGGVGPALDGGAIAVQGCKKV